MTFTPITYNSQSRLGTVKYNGFQFPPAIKSTARFTPVYDDAHRLLKYTRVELRVECFIFVGSTDTSTTYTPQTTVGVPSGSGQSLDPTFDFLRELLMEPGKELFFTAQGAGAIHVQDTSGLNPDVENGPHPAVVEWVPLTNKMARITWTCTTAFKNCSDEPTSIISGGTGAIAQLPFSVSFDVNQRGLSVRTVAGKIEIPLSLDAISGLSKPFSTKAMREQVCKLFPLIPQFHRSYHFDLSEDRKTLAFTITDTEIDSDEPYGAGCAHETAKLNLAGQLIPSGGAFSAGGFINWKCTLSGSIQLLAGFPKSYAWDEITRIFNWAYVESSKKANGPVQTSTTGTVGQDSPGSTTPSSAGAKVILLAASFGDDFFGREVSFNFEWFLSTTPETLFAATGAFSPITQSPAQITDLWNKYRDSLNFFMADGGGFQGLYINEQDDIIVSLCEPLQQGNTGTYTPPVRPKPPEHAKPKADKTSDKQDKNNRQVMVLWDGTFHYVTKEYASVHSALWGNSSQKEPDPPTSPGPFTPVPGGYDRSKATPNIIHKTRDSQYTVTFSGKTIQIDYPPPIPTLAVYGGQPCTKIGDGLVYPVKMGRGVDVITGRSYQVFGLAWSFDYALPGPPINATMTTDGFKDRYV